MKQYTTLDTHDGIGIVDVKDLRPDEENLTRIRRYQDSQITLIANLKPHEFVIE